MAQVARTAPRLPSSPLPGMHAGLHNHAGKNSNWGTEQQQANRARHPPTPQAPHQEVVAGRHHAHLVALGVNDLKGWGQRVWQAAGVRRNQAAQPSPACHMRKRQQHAPAPRHFMPFKCHVMLHQPSRAHLHDGVCRPAGAQDDNHRLLRLHPQRAACRCVCGSGGASVAPWRVFRWGWAAK